ncbi:MAG TPA: ornithine cyclodeaminase [Chloroflexota bacterium]|nr:ornithine cyclodeaminase [Chloroflexota bacterium]
MTTTSPAPHTAHAAPVAAPSPEATSTADEILYLRARDVREALQEVDPVAVIRAVLRRHGAGDTVLPDEAYLPWTTPAGDGARSLNMPAYVGAGEGQGEDGTPVAGTKVINGNPGNVRRGLPRASGVTMLFDVATARITCIMEGARISATRTAAVTAAAAGALEGPPVRCLAVIGAGALAAAHLSLLPGRLPQLREVRLFDLDGERAEALRRAAAPDLEARGVRLEVAPSAEGAIRPAQLIVPVTTTTTGYIALDWLQPGAILVNVSLDDPLPEVALRADRLFVDDWPLVRADSRRLLGRMYRAGQIEGPDAPPSPRGTTPRPIDGELGQVLAGLRPGRLRERDVILVNPFGLAIEDVALAAEVHRAATRRGLGLWLER